MSLSLDDWMKAQYEEWAEEKVKRDNLLASLRMLMLPGTESNKDSVPPLSLIFIYQTRSGSAISSLGYFIPTIVPFLNTQNLGTLSNFWQKCPALGIKNYTVGGMETAFTLPKFPKNIGIGF